MNHNLAQHSQAKGLQLHSVTVAYGSVVALHNLDLGVRAGETLAVIGPSGSGKSTLLRAVAGLEPLVSGKVILDGRNLVGVATHRRDLGFMFQDHALFPHLDVAGNVGFGLRMNRWGPKSRRTRVAELLDLVGLDGFGSRPVQELSGGEAQRVALARALAPKPGLLMLDEPFGSLDLVLRRQLGIELRRLLTELGQTAIHVTHDQDEGFAVADRVAVMSQGRLVQIGRPEQVWRAPVDSFVARFVGHTNLWTIEVDPSGVAHWQGNRLGELGHWPSGRHEVIAPTPAITVVVGDELSGLRANTPDSAGVELTVVSVRWSEGRYRVIGRLRERDGTTVEFEATHRLGEGDQVRVVIDVDQLHRLASGSSSTKVTRG